MVKKTRTNAENPAVQVASDISSAPISREEFRNREKPLRPIHIPKLCCTVFMLCDARPILNYINSIRNGSDELFGLAGVVLETIVDANRQPMYETTAEVEAEDVEILMHLFREITAYVRKVNEAQEKND